jgi:hypothetical protein
MDMICRTMGTNGCKRSTHILESGWEVSVARRFREYPFGGPGLRLTAEYAHSKPTSSHLEQVGFCRLPRRRHNAQMCPTSVPFPYIWFSYCILQRQLGSSMLSEAGSAHSASVTDSFLCFRIFVVCSLHSDGILGVMCESKYNTSREMTCMEEEGGCSEGESPAPPVISIDEIGRFPEQSFFRRRDFCLNVWESRETNDTVGLPDNLHKESQCRRVS